MHAGNAKVIQASNISLQAGDSVSITGETVQFGNGNVFVARLIQKGSQSVAVRSKNGVPLLPTAVNANGKIVLTGGCTMRTHAVKRIFLAGSLALGLYAAACGGGNSTFTPTPTPTPTPQGTYSLASLNGTYAFSMSGTDNTQGLSISRIGSFHADGQGNITMAIEDVNDAGSFSTFNFTAAPASNYTMSSNGRGVLTLSHPDVVNPSVADNFTFSIALDSTSSGLMIETDGSSTMSGNFRLQTISSTFATAYAFDVSGVDLGNSTSASFIGQFTTNGVSGVTGGEMDVNDGASPTGAIALQPGTVTLDADQLQQLWARNNDPQHHAE